MQKNLQRAKPHHFKKDRLNIDFLSPLPQASVWREAVLVQGTG